MNIILGQDKVADLSDRYVVLPLDTFNVSGHPDPITSFCVIEQVSIQDLSQLGSWRALHEKLIENYHKKNWNFCEQAVEHLVGRWNGELDSFYLDLLGRIKRYQQQDPGEEWTGIITR